MRHKYDTHCIVLARSPLGEANTFVTLLTRDLGVVRARAQGLRRPGAKLAASLATYVESAVTLVRGKEHWRASGAVLEENWFARLEHGARRTRAARVSGLLLRLVVGETQDPGLFPIMKGFFGALSTLPEDLHEAVEMLAVLRILAALGFDAGEIPGERNVYTPELLLDIANNRAKYLARINHDLTASEL